MSVTHEVKLHLYLVAYSWDPQPKYAVFESATMEEQCSENYTYQHIRPLEFQVPHLPDPNAIDHVGFRLEGIRRAQRHLMAEYQNKMNELKSAEQSLLSIENAVSEPNDDHSTF